jgi:hypothetical protein
VYTHVLAQVVVSAEVLAAARVGTFVGCGAESSGSRDADDKRESQTFFIRVDAPHMPLQMLAPREALSTTVHFARIQPPTRLTIHIYGWVTTPAVQTSSSSALERFEGGYPTTSALLCEIGDGNGHR